MSIYDVGQDAKQSSIRDRLNILAISAGRLAEVAAEIRKGIGPILPAPAVVGPRPLVGGETARIKTITEVLTDIEGLIKIIEDELHMTITNLGL